MDYRRADELLGVWRRQARRQKLRSDATAIMFAAAIWLGLGAVVLIGMLRFSQL